MMIDDPRTVKELIEKWREKLQFFEQQIARWSADGFDSRGVLRADHQARAAVCRDVLRDADRLLAALGDPPGHDETQGGMAQSPSPEVIDTFKGTRVVDSQYHPPPTEARPLATAASNKPGPAKCPTCDSSAPHLHPAMQCEGEVQECRDPFHSIWTPQNARYLKPATPTDAPASIVWQIEVFREDDGRFAAEWFTLDRAESGMGPYAATPIGALAELCATLIKVAEDA